MKINIDDPSSCLLQLNSSSSSEEDRGSESEEEDPFASLDGNGDIEGANTKTAEIVEEEEKRVPVYNAAGIDVSEFMNKDFNKPVPLFRSTVKRQKKSAMDYN